MTTDVPLTSVVAAQERLRKAGITAEDLVNLAEKLGIAIERARLRHAPQEVHIMIDQKAFVNYINLSDNYPRHSRGKPEQEKP